MNLPIYAANPPHQAKCPTQSSLTAEAVVAAKQKYCRCIPNGVACHVLATRIHARDVCGAGDTVLATLGLGVARGESLHDTCKLAVMTAAEQVSQIGIAPMLNAALPA